MKTGVDVIVVFMFSEPVPTLAYTPSSNSLIFSSHCCYCHRIAITPYMSLKLSLPLSFSLAFKQTQTRSNCHTGDSQVDAGVHFFNSVFIIFLLAHFFFIHSPLPLSSLLSSCFSNIILFLSF